MKEKGYTNVYQVPRIEKIVVNRGLGDCKDNAQSFNKAVDELGIITGQKLSGRSVLSLGVAVKTAKVLKSMFTTK